jgi:hypothetical protein
MVRSLRNIFTAILLTGFTHTSIAQYQQVTILSDKVNGIGPCEPTIFINPKSPNKMVVSMINDKTMQTTNTKTGQDKVYFSKDYGVSWSDRKAKSKYGDFGDPCLIADNEGYFYYFHMSDPEKMGWEGEQVMDRIVCQRSKNGKRWNKGVSIGYDPPKKHENPWATFHETSGRLYVCWTQYDNYNSSNPQDSAHIMVSISNDRGLSWANPIRINQYGGDCSGDIGTPMGAIPSAGPDQDVYVTWAYNEKIYFDRSVDGGVIWLKEDVVVADQPGGWHFDVPGFGKAPGTPVNGCDISYGPFHGNIYVSWADQRNGKENTDIFISKSSDRGNTWSEPKMVNDDEVVMMGRHQCYNWMTVDPITGYIYIVFYDRRNYNDLKTDVYLAMSVDGGETFKNEQINAEPFVPNSDVYLGDYINIAAYGGFVRPVWTSLKDGRLNIMTAIINPR